MDHEPFCVGWHRDSISCVLATSIRAEWDADPWICRFSTDRGQPVHWFHEGGGKCRFEGCDVQLSELMKR